MQANGFDKQAAYAQAEAMVAVVFNASAETLDGNNQLREETAKRLVGQLPFIAAGAKSYYLR